MLNIKTRSIVRRMDEIINKHSDWKGEVITQLRALFSQADLGLAEEVKWRMKTRPEGLPVWTNNGIVCFAEIWKDNVKLLFPKGAKLSDPHQLFNARLQSKDIRAIEFKEGDTINKVTLLDLTKKAIRYNS